MSQPEIKTGIEPELEGPRRVSSGDLVEWYFDQGWTDGLPVVPPTPERVAEHVEALGGEADLVECRVPPRGGNLSREIMAIFLRDRQP